MHKPNLLFICSRNEWRSRTAEALYRNDDRYNVRSGGTARGARIRVRENMLEWADRIYCMEDKHRACLIRRFGQGEWSDRIEVLGIPDLYRYMDPELVAEIKAVVEEQF